MAETNSTIEAFIIANKENVNRRLEEILRQDEEILAKEILEAARYMVLDAGHRWRPLLALAVYDALKKQDHQEEEDLDNILNAACAVELLHSASLIYDDIFDKSELRRGQLTCHIKYGQDIALLTTLYLVSRANLLLSRINNNKKSLPELAFYCINSMIYGQALDVKSMITDEASLLKAHKLKSTIYVFAAELGAIISGADDETIKAIADYSEAIGIAYLIEDDILDVEGTEKGTGKPLGQDKKLGKYTAVDAYGLDGAKRKLEEYIQEAKQTIAQIPNNKLLIQFLDYMFKRYISY